MFGNKNKSSKEDEKLRKPQTVPEPVQKYLINEMKLPSHLAPLFKAAMGKKTSGEDAYSIRIFDESEADARKVKVNDYTTLDAHPELILYEGIYDQVSKKVELEEKTKVNWDTTIFNVEEITQQIEAMQEPGSTIFFYAARGSTRGGPLGMGAVVIELDPGEVDKKGPKYNIYVADVVDMQPVDKGQKMFESRKIKEIAEWVKTGHIKREY